MLEAYCAKRRPKERCDGGRCVHDLPSSNISVSVPCSMPPRAATVGER